MADPLLNVPGLGGWLSQRDRNMEESRENLAQVGRMRTLQSGFQEDALKRQARAEFEAMGPNPRPEQLVQWAAKYSPAKDVLNQVQHAETSRNQQALTGELGRQRIADADAAKARDEAYRRDALGQQLFLGNQASADRRTIATQASADRAAALAQRDTPRLQPGFSVDPSDPSKVTPTPGGKPWRDMSSKHATDMQAALATRTQTDGALDKIDRILDPKRSSAFSSNFGGYNALVTQYLPGDSQNMRKEIESFKAEMKAAGLNLLRAGGGSIGAISVAEWPIIEQQIDAISPMLGEKAAKEAFQRIRVRMKRLENNVLHTYDTEWGDSPFHQRDLRSRRPQAPRAGPTTSSVPQGVDPAVWQVMTPEERALWRD